MNQYFIIFSALGSVCALLFAVFMAKRALSFSEGSDQMKKIASFIRQGANAYLRRQYSVVLIFFACMFAILCLMAALHFLTWFVPFAFITGGFFSGLSGFVGMKIATASNARTARGTVYRDCPGRSSVCDGRHCNMLVGSRRSPAHQRRH